MAGMREWIGSVCALLLVATGTASPSKAQTPAENAASSDPGAKVASKDQIVFVPPAVGTPASRVGAGTRGTEVDAAIITLLVPPEGGLTSSDKPPLIWRVTEDFSGAMHADVVDTSPGGTGVARTVEGRFRRGFFALDLQRSDMSMTTGRIYRWTVSVTEADSGKVLASASGLVERVDGASPDGGISGNTVRAAAAAGLWFDALAPLFSVGLSGQARLKDAAQFDELGRSAGLPAAAHAPD